MKALILQVLALELKTWAQVVAPCTSSVSLGKLSFVCVFDSAVLPWGIYLFVP